MRLNSRTSAASVLLVSLVVGGASCAGVTAAGDRSSHRLTEDERKDDISRAGVWKATDVARMDLRAGPQDTGAVAPFATVTCDYVERDLGGSSLKFACALAPHDTVRIKYGEDNYEVAGVVAASRLLWALGFGADRWYPVRVVCHGCSANPFHDKKAVPGDTVFDMAALERPFGGKVLETHDDEGWSWTELALMARDEDGRRRAQRDALKLLAVLMQHTDNKPQQQRLVCLDAERAPPGAPCLAPFMYLHDVGLTFGKATALNRAEPSAVNLENWLKADIWENREKCVGNLPKSFTGTLSDPVISEGGRRFLADLLQQLSDAQLHDLFEVARVPKMSGATVDDWVTAFKAKREQIVSARCPS